MSDRLINLASARLGAVAMQCSDDFFADKSRMLSDSEPVFIEGKYDDNGKWMDGWESRRKRGPGHDWCLVRLARVGHLDEIEIDTRHFTGNYAPAASVQACLSNDDQPGEDAAWHEIVAITPLIGNDRRRVVVSESGPFSHIRLQIHPDGGVARLRVLGRPLLEFSGSSEAIDLAASLNGGVALACNNAHFGSMHNLLAPGRGINMGDGWETRRRRQPGHDWVIIQLGCAGTIERVEIDTAHFKGNYPDRCSMQAALVEGPHPDSIAARSLYWAPLLAEHKLEADRTHVFKDALLDVGRVNCVRLNIHPDGGVSRLRVFARPARD
jgi:allantoicase